MNQNNYTSFYKCNWKLFRYLFNDNINGDTLIAIVCIVLYCIVECGEISENLSRYALSKF